VDAVLERYGKLPLPPYITHAADAEDDERYQTVFAREQGASPHPRRVALRPDHAGYLACQGVNIAYVTLHVGAGTFQPVRAENVADHAMHSERYNRAASHGGRHQNRPRRTAGAWWPWAPPACARWRVRRPAGNGRRVGRDAHLHHPGYRFRVVEVLLTNFHLPRSTLLMLVCAFGGMDRMLAAYRHAVAQEYRFFSYGDAMLIEREQ